MFNIKTLHVSHVVETITEMMDKKKGYYEKVHALRPMMKYLINNYSYPLVGVEIGTWRGENAFHTLMNNPKIKKLYLVDPYVVYFDGWDESPSDVEMVDNEKIARKRLKPFQSKTVFVKEPSENAVKDIPDGVDFVYIDGNHSYEYVKRDIEVYYPIVKEGGVIGGHDYNPVFPGVSIAVNAFVAEHGLVLHGLNIDWWVVKEGYK